MDARTLTALKGSIVKWEQIVAGTGADRGVENCPLCMEFLGFVSALANRCKGCPVMERTRRTMCMGSPYEAWDSLSIRSIDNAEDPAEAARLAQAELDFLKSLLPAEDESKA